MDADAFVISIGASKGIQLVVIENQQSFIPKLRRYMKPSNPFLEITLDDNLNLTFKDSRAFLSHLGIEGEIIHTPGHTDDSISLILDEGIAFTGDLPGPTRGEDSLHQVETSWRRIRALNGVTGIASEPLKDKLTVSMIINLSQHPDLINFSSHNCIC